MAKKSPVSVNGTRKMSVVGVLIPSVADFATDHRCLYDAEVMFIKITPF